MSDEVFRPSRKKIDPNDVPQVPNVADIQQDQGDPMESVRAVQEAAAKETGREFDHPNPFSNPEGIQIKGNIPPEFRKMMQERGGPQKPVQAQPQVPRPTADAQVRLQGSGALEDLIGRLTAHFQWEEIELPSKSRFYTGIPPVLHVRAMTGEEEQILSTARFVKKGKAIDMIFQKCVQERIDTEQLLSVDRNYLLIFLRGISYTPDYDVEIKCPECGVNFATVINLDSIGVENCPDNFGPDNLVGVLPTSGFNFRYRLATGKDEQEITSYRERRIQMFGDQSEDDTLLFRTALLLDWIEGVTDRTEIQVLLKRLPINDVSHLRNTINDPPFGVETQIDMVCPSCAEEFKIELPLETNFFFPRKKETRTQA